MRSSVLFAALSGIVVSSALTSAPAFAQSDLPIIATITVPVTIDFLDTEAIKSAPSISCGLFAGSGEDLLASGTTPIPMVSTQATATTRSMSSFAGNVVVTIRPRPAPAGSSASSETAAQTAVKYALAQATAYRCQLGTSGGQKSSGIGYEYLTGYSVGQKFVLPVKSTLSVKGTFNAPKS